MHKNYTEAIGKALHIIPAQNPAPDPALLQPDLTYDFNAGHPVLYWYHNGTDALVIEADYGTGTFGLVAIYEPIPHIKQVIAQTKAKTFFIPKEEFMNILEHYPNIQEGIIAELCKIIMRYE